MARRRLTNDELTVKIERVKADIERIDAEIERVKEARKS